MTDPFDTNFPSTAVAEQLGDLLMRLQGVETAAVLLTNVISHVAPEQLEEVRRFARLQFQESALQPSLDGSNARAQFQRMLAETLYILETPDERLRLRPPSP